MSADIDVIVTSVRAAARDVITFTLKHKSDQVLPGGTAGSHIDLALPNGMVRQYSLVNANGQKTLDQYEVAVGWDTSSRGGSIWIHEKLKVGQAIKVSSPRNHFEMAQDHTNVLLIAGGIGITPIFAMAQSCIARGIQCELWASARSAARLAYSEELKRLLGDKLTVHFDDQIGGPMDLRSRLEIQKWDAVYACGPAPMLDAITFATTHWETGSVRMERFKAEELPETQRKSFELVLQQSGITTVVSEGESVLDAMNRVGVDSPWSCREGICGTCEVAVLEGDVDHLDYVLSPEERKPNNRMMVCVSRCGNGKLVLDI